MFTENFTLKKGQGIRAIFQKGIICLDNSFSIISLMNILVLPFPKHELEFEKLR
jgi:hypothetical protein